ncbi:MAG: hypothetical protein AAFU77_03960 [Myxococcota bacterium]
MSDRPPIEIEEQHVGERDGPLSDDEGSYLAALEDHRARFLANESATEFFSRSGLRPSRRRRWPQLTLGVGLALAVAASAVFFSVPESASDRIRLRGESHFSVVVLRDGEQLQVDRALVARPGDKLRFQLQVTVPGNYEVGFLGANRRYQRLASERFVEAGLRFFATAVELDDQPLDGVLVAGLKREVERFVDDDRAKVSIRLIEVSWK